MSSPELAPGPQQGSTDAGSGDPSAAASAALAPTSAASAAAISASAAATARHANDARALCGLRRDLQSLRRGRDALRAAVDDCGSLVAAHHAARALENVAAARSLDALRDRLAARQDAARGLAADVAIAESEHRRLAEVHRALAGGIRDKSAERGRVRERLGVLAQCERQAAALERAVRGVTSGHGRRRAQLADAAAAVGRVIGGHHGAAVFAEQRRIDARLEVDSLRSRLAALVARADAAAAAEAAAAAGPPNAAKTAGSGDGAAAAAAAAAASAAPGPDGGGSAAALLVAAASLGATRGNPALCRNLHPCENAECVRVRRAVRDAKQRLDALTADLPTAQRDEISRRAGIALDRVDGLTLLR